MFSWCKRHTVCISVEYWTALEINSALTSLIIVWSTFSACIIYITRYNDRFGQKKMLTVIKLICFHLTGGKCINGRKLEPFEEVFAGPPGQLSRWTCFSKLTNKKVITKNQAKNVTIVVTPGCFNAFSRTWPMSIRVAMWENIPSDTAHDDLFQPEHPRSLIRVITKLRLYNFDPIKPHFHIVKRGL